MTTKCDCCTAEARTERKLGVFYTELCYDCARAWDTARNNHLTNLRRNRFQSN